ncbi:MAG: SAM-dependent methyltransferase [Proteobacteria bacterium SW_6_67_9]|nr:MAG: SAM-dependent methyltransferase [Proteobacteria bacterium SW_6_67_9]
MSQSTLQLDATLAHYLHERSLREPGPCRRLRAAANERDDAHLLSSPEQVQLLALLARLMRVRRVVEVGTYVGYTPLWLSLALGPGARATCIEQDRALAQVARQAWDEAGVGERIELVCEPADRALGDLRHDGRIGPFDLAYIDADKAGQIDHYEGCLDLVRPGGLIAVDNTLWQGRVADPDDTSATTAAIRRFNAYVHGDERVALSLVPIGDGVTLLQKLDPDDP